MTRAQEAELRRALQLESLHDINTAIGLLRDLEAVEPVSLPFAVMRYVLQEIDHRFEGQAVTLETWRRVKDLSPSFGAVVDSLTAGNRDAAFAAMNTLTSSWTRLLASIA